MLELFGVSIDSNVIKLENILSLTVNQDENVPADDMSVTLSYKKDLPEFNRIILKQDGETVFTGIVDEQQTVVDKDNVYNRIIARSMAAVLLDNESMPVSYLHPTTSTIFERHIKQFGIESYKGEDKPIKEALNVSKGSTNWQVAAAFCQKAFGTLPRVESSGTINFNGIESDLSLKFSNTNGIKYSSVKENNKRCKILSNVRVKLKADSSYTLNVKNTYAKKRAISRERYVDASGSMSSPKVAQKMINNSNCSSYELVIAVPQILLNSIGAKASLNDSVIGDRQGLYVSSVYYRFNSNGEFTTLTLKKEN